MERIPFNLQLAKEGNTFLLKSGDEYVECIFIEMDDYGFYYQRSDFATGMCCPIADLKHKDWSMKPKEESIWSDWITHDGGECPIPDVKAGDWQFGSNIKSYAASEDANFQCYKDFWTSKSATYRIKKHLLKPTNEVLLPPITPPIDDAHLIKESPKLKKTAFPLPKLDQYILNYVYEEPKGALHDDEGMSRLITNLMRK